MKRKAPSAIILTLLLASVLLLAFDIQMAKAESAVIDGERVATLQGTSTPISGYISENTTWTLESSPYIVTGDVVVEPGVFLTIEPGVTIKFTSGTALVIDGSLFAQGNLTHKINFTSNAATPASGDWGKILFRGNSCILDHIDIEYAATGLQLSSPANISNSQIHNSRTAIEGILDTAYNINVTNNGPSEYAISVSDQPDLAPKIIQSRVSDNLVDTAINIQMNEIFGKDSLLVDSEIIDNSGNGLTVFSIPDRRFIVHGSEISRNGNGVRIKDPGPSTITIEESSVAGNMGYGIYAPGEFPSFADIDIKRSNVSYNGLDGIAFMGFGKWDITATETTIAFNNHTGVSGVTGELSYCNVHGNKAYDVKAGSGDVNARFNWWGTTNETILQEHIYDYYDDYGLGRVFYEPYLLAPVLNITLLDFTLSPNPAYVGQQVTLSGRLTDLVSNPIASAKIELSSSSDGGANWTIVGYVITNTSGFFGGEGKIGSAGKYLIKANYYGSETYGPSSRIETLTVLNRAATQIFLRLNPNPTIPGQKATLMGILLDQYVTPVKSATIILHYSTDYGSTWHYAGTLTTNQFGIFSVTFISPPTGIYLIRADYNGSTQYEPSTAVVSLIIR